MIKCNRVKNPCKICLQSVNQKNGLQCRGACQNWVHYSCLNYTPGKVKDIKLGVIKITCPCPDCKTTMPKEYRTDEPYSCTNLKCPANKPPVCENATCPSNVDPPHLTQKQPSKPRTPMTTCGDSCKDHAAPNANAPNNCQITTKSSSLVQDTPSSSSSSSCQNNVGDAMNLPLKHIEQMCKTVGQLTGQINELMSTLKTCIKEVQETKKPKKTCVSKKPQAPPTCNQSGPRSLCPKPCYCPGNPGQ